MNHTLLKYGATAILAFLLTSCGMFGYHVKVEKEQEPEPPEPTQIEITFTAAKDVNLNPAGRPSPLIVRLYALKEYRTFVNEDFFDLDSNDEGLLGSDLLYRDELVFEPGESKTYTKKLADETLYLGFIARYIDINNAKWRDAVNITAQSLNKILVRLDAEGIEAEKPEKEGLPSFDEVKDGVDKAHGTVKDISKGKDDIKDTVDKAKDIKDMLKW